MHTQNTIKLVLGMTLSLNSNGCLAEKEWIMLLRGKGSCHTEGMKENCFITSALIYFLYQAHMHTSILGEQRHTGTIILESGADKCCPSGASLSHSKRGPAFLCCARPQGSTAPVGQQQSLHQQAMHSDSFCTGKRWGTHSLQQ